MKKYPLLLSALAAASISSASAATVAYWDFDNANLASAVNNGVYGLTQVGTGYTGSTTNLTSPVPNPDAVAGAANGGSIGYTVSDPDSYLLSGSGSRAGFNLNGNSWTFEGWLDIASAPESFDPILATRNGLGGDGIMFDLRNVSGGVFFNLYLDARGGTGTGSASGTATEEPTSFRAVAAPTDAPFHFALTYSASKFELFVNGESKVTHTTSLNLSHIDSAANDNFTLLGRSGDADGAFGGSADEFRLSNTVLSSSQFLNAIPEPSAAVLLGLSAFGLLLRRCRN